MITTRRAEDHGQSDLGWLDSRHTFSFANYYDPNHMGVSALRVINDDRVIPGRGFETHGHRDMEIISYVIEGTLAHKDSYGHVENLPAGEFQLMSAGSGIYHSEFNPSASEPLNFLQIWILPTHRGGTPGYQQKAFPQNGALTAVVTPDGRNGTLQIKQDATLYRLQLAAGLSQSLPISAERTGYLHLIKGELQLGEATLKPGDGATITQQEGVEVIANADIEALLFDLP